MTARAQSNLLALAVALLLLTAAIGVALVLAGTPFAGSQPNPTDRYLAHTVATQFVSEASPLTRRHGVLNQSAVEALNASTVRRLGSLPPGAAVTVRFGNVTFLSAPSSQRGVSVRRLVTVTDWEWVRYEPTWGNDSRVTLPATPRIQLGVNGSNTTVDTVRINGRVVLHDPTGIEGPVTIDVPRSNGVTVSVSGSDSLARGDVWVRFPVVETKTGVLVVTVDA